MCAFVLVGNLAKFLLQIRSSDIPSCVFDDVDDVEVGAVDDRRAPPTDKQQQKATSYW